VVFDKIMAACQKNHHRVFIVTMNSMFDGNLNELRPFIVEAERESYEMGRRISRTAQYKKSREPAWGMMRNERDEIVNNPRTEN